VTLSLPLIQAANEDAAVAAMPSSPVTRGLRVLAVEDRELLLHMLKQTLEQMGMQVSTAANAEEALAAVARDGTPDLLISDIVMPGKLDGLELAAQLREHDARLPILLMSGYSRSVDPTCTFLRKPFSVNELEQAIGRTLTPEPPLAVSG